MTSDGEGWQSLRECESLVAQLRATLPTAVNGEAVSPTAKIPYKVVLLSADLSYRIAELADATLALLADRYRVAAAMTARAAMETAALHFYVVTKIRGAIQAGASNEVDVVLVRALTGTKVFEGESKQPINVLTAIACTDKRFAGFSAFYNELSEYAHPNYFGSHFAYVADGESEFHAAFSADHAPGLASGVITCPLAVALTVFGHSRATLATELPSFVALCEREVAGPGA